MEGWVRDALSQWREESVEINPGVSIADLEKAEAQIKFKFPDDFKLLYLTVNGFVKFEQRGFMLSLWSLDRILEEYNENKPLIAFSDHSLSVCQYGFNRSSKGIFKAYEFQKKGVESKPIAQSFKEMILLFNCDSEVLF